MKTIPIKFEDYQKLRNQASSYKSRNKQLTKQLKDLREENRRILAAMDQIIETVKPFSIRIDREDDYHYSDDM